MSTPRAVSVLALVAAGATCVTACGGRLTPAEADEVFAGAEALRLRYERAATGEALEMYGKARDAWRRHGDVAKAARATERIGLTHEQTGALGPALDRYREALSLAEQSEDPLLESEISSAVGLLAALSGSTAADFDEAEARCRRGLTLATESGGLAERGKALNCYGEVAYARGGRTEAVAFYEQAEPYWRASSDRRGLAETLLFLGYAHSDMRSFEAARTYYAEALEIWTAVGDRRGEASTRVAIGRLRTRLNEHQEALDELRPARDLFREMGDRLSEASSLEGMGSVLFQLGEYRLAIDYWNDALTLFDAAGLDNYAVDVLMLLGRGHLALGQHDDALRLTRRALDLSVALENTRWQAYALRDYGLALQESGRPADALGYLERALALQEASQDPRLEAEALGDVANAHLRLGNHGEAIRYFERSLAVSRACRDRLGEASSLFGLAVARGRIGEVDAAVAHVRDAIAVAESLRAEVAGHDLRASYLASVHEYYQLHVDMLMQKHAGEPGARFAAAAFEASEAARARSLMERLAAAGVDLRDGLDPALLADEARLREALSAKYEEDAARLTGDTGRDADATLAAEIERLQADYELAQARIRASSPGYAALADPQPLTLAEVQREVLDGDTLLLEYALGDERSFVWAVSRNGLSAFELPARGRIESLAADVYALATARVKIDPADAQWRMRVRQADADYWSTAALLSDMLLGPVRHLMPGRRLVIVAEGALQYLPFGALPAPEPAPGPVPLIVDHEVVSLPSASALAVMRRHTARRPVPPKAVAVLADPVYEADDSRFDARLDGRRPERAAPAAPAIPDRSLRDVGFERDGRFYVYRLDATGAEAERIAALAPRDGTLKATGFAASRTMAMSAELRNYRIVHFATHSLFVDDRPGVSGVLLSRYDAEGREYEDGFFLRLHDIYNMRLPAELVVLSACSTAFGDDIDGEGLVGIVRGFMYAGSKRVMASLWKVDDLATAELMSRFYRGLFEEHRTPSEALRQAQISMWQEAEWRQPFYWAAFVLQGEWRED